VKRPHAVLGAILSYAVFLNASSPAKNAVATRKPELTRQFLTQFDIAGSRRQAERRLATDPANPEALFVRMETAELQNQPAAVLDSALRLCASKAEGDVKAVASGRILEYAANSSVFQSFVRRVQSQGASACSPNLRLALVMAAADGERDLDLDQTARAAGLLTKWQVTGPLGRFSNPSFDRKWAVEEELLSKGSESRNSAETFWFRNGSIVLPDYIPASGVFYGWSEINWPQGPTAVLYVWGGGPYAVWIDGRQVLAHDSRALVLGTQDSERVSLNPGKHRIVVKFTSDAIPLRMALEPPGGPEEERTSPSPLGEYVSALAAYQRGDLVALERILAINTLAPGPTRYLRALLESAIAPVGEQSRSAWKALAEAQPAATIAQMQAEPRFHADPVKPGTGVHPSELQVESLLRGLGANDSRREDLLERLVQLHPSCANIRELSRTYGSSGEQEPALKAERRLAGCAPEDLQYAEVLSAEGKHRQAILQLHQALRANPWNRAARLMEIREMALDGNEAGGREAAEALHREAPGWAQYTSVVRNPESILDSRSRRGEQFVNNDEFFTPFRKNALQVIQSGAQRTFSGGPAVFLLDDRVLRFADNGEIYDYRHKIIRVLNKDGVTRYGEVALPAGADLLELRTIKADGRIAEPELTGLKAAISMPGLEPGDAIDEEFVTSYADQSEVPRDALTFTFGSFEAPILQTSFTAMAPLSQTLEYDSSSAMAQPQITSRANARIYSWTSGEIPQSPTELSLPEGTLLPHIQLRLHEDFTGRLQDELMSATRVGPLVTEAALRIAGSGSELEKARSLNRFVDRTIAAGNDWTTTTAEESLLESQGSRTATLIALARAAGLNAQLILARRLTHVCTRPDSPDCFDVPLVRLELSNRQEVDLDAETPGMPFGWVAATVDRSHALLITDETGEGPLRAVPLSPKTLDERTTATADMNLDSAGNLDATVRVRLGAMRSQQVREVLGRLSSAERQTYFEQFAMRMFPGAASVTGLAIHERELEQPLEVVIHCGVAQYANLDGSKMELDTFMPALGLRAMLARTPSRKYSLAVDSLLSESAEFHLHLPAGLEIKNIPEAFTAKSGFGEYSIRFEKQEHQLTVQRQFRIPVQVISAESYPSFAEFTRQVDGAEHWRIQLTNATPRNAQLVDPPH